MAKFCHNCGSPLEGAPKFCPSCGAQVIEVQPQEESAPQPPTEKTPEQREMKNPPVQRQTPQPPMRQEAQGQNSGQPSYDSWPGQGAPQQGYGVAGAAMFGGGAYVPDEGISQMFFRYDNRLNRKRYILRGLAVGVGVMVVALVVSVILVMVGADESIVGTIGTLIGFGGGVAGLMLGIRRLHDLDRPTWWIVGHFIPIVNVALALYLLFAEGTYGPNQYGPDPLEGKH